MNKCQAYKVMSGCAELLIHIHTHALISTRITPFCSFLPLLVLHLAIQVVVQSRGDALQEYNAAEVGGLVGGGWLVVRGWTSWVRCARVWTCVGPQTH